MIAGATLAVLAAVALARWGWRLHRAAIDRAVQRAEDAEWQAHAAQVRLERATRQVCHRRRQGPPGPALRRCTDHYAPCGPGGCDD